MQSKLRTYSTWSGQCERILTLDGQMKKKRDEWWKNARGATHFRSLVWGPHSIPLSQHTKSPTVNSFIDKKIQIHLLSAISTHTGAQTVSLTFLPWAVVSCWLKVEETTTTKKLTSHHQLLFRAYFLQIDGKIKFTRTSWCRHTTAVGEVRHTFKQHNRCRP